MALFIVIFICILGVLWSLGLLQPSASSTAPVANQQPTPSEAQRQYEIEYARFLAELAESGLSPQERLTMGFPVEYIGTSGDVELLSPEDPLYAELAKALLKPTNGRR